MVYIYAKLGLDSMDCQSCRSGVRRRKEIWMKWNMVH
jgi:hypothetical protein